MTARPSPPGAPLSPAKQVERFIARFDPPIAKLARAARAVLRKRYPTAVELVYDTYALAIGYSPNERPSDAFVSLAIYARGINLYFVYGAVLPDPERLLQGKGNQGRFIRLENVAQLDQPAVKALLQAAVDEGDTPLPKTGRGCTVIKSSADKQRPRRPRARPRGKVP